MEQRQWKAEVRPGQEWYRIQRLHPEGVLNGVTPAKRASNKPTTWQEKRNRRLSTRASRRRTARVSA